VTTKALKEEGEKATNGLLSPSLSYLCLTLASLAKLRRSLRSLSFAQWLSIVLLNDYCPVFGARAWITSSVMSIIGLYQMTELITASALCRLRTIE
jgi:hypothetical protein